jgi:trimeric autotransporter adhesin
MTRLISRSSGLLLCVCLPLAISATTIPAKADNVCPGTTISNTCYGSGALSSNTAGYNNTANGYFALNSNTGGYNNTANGYFALYSNTAGNNNTANGYFALYSNMTGYSNTAIGNSALYSNTEGSLNTAIGNSALLNNMTGGDNTAIGNYALLNNTFGSNNTANGWQALFYNTKGLYNTAIGNSALSLNKTGSNNVALGSSAGFNITGSDNVDIANRGVAGDSGVIRIGTSGTQTSTYIAGIRGTTVTKGVAVYIDSNGQLGVKKSSRRFKMDIRSLGTTSEKILNLRPVTFRYKQADEKGDHPRQYGLIAEEVAKVFPDLVQYDKEGKPFTVNFDSLTPLLLGEVQRQQAQLVSEKIQLATQKAQLASLRSENQRLHQQLANLQAQQEQILKAVSARLNELERAVQVNGKAKQAPTTVLTSLPSSSR